jgi:hypothetical protein
MTCGSNAYVADETILASGSTPRSAAAFSLAITTALAPSLSGD